MELLNGFIDIFSFTTLFLIAGGVFVGIIFGAIGAISFYSFGLIFTNNIWNAAYKWNFIFNSYICRRTFRRIDFSYSSWN